MVESWRNERALFQGVEAYERVERVFTGGSEPETMRGARVSPGLFLLGVAPEHGRAFAPDEAANPVAVISRATWRIRFGGDADIIGRPLRFSDGELTIVGVMPPSFRFPDPGTAYWEPMDVGRRAASGDPSERRVSVVARLGRDVTFEQADARAAALAPQWDPEWFSQLLTESLLLSAFAGLVGLVFGGWLAGVAGTAGQPVFGPGRLNPIDLDGRAAAWAVVAALLAGVVATLPPAWRTVGRDLMPPMHGRGSAAANGHGRLRGGLVAVQSALAVMLLIGALLMGGALWRALDIDIGWTAQTGAGLYAVVAYETSARTHEIGVRVALGATRGAVIRQVLGRSLLQSATGAALGLPGAYAATRLLALPTDGTDPTFPATFATAAVFLLAAAVTGAWLPARRAARSDAMAALRAE